MTDYQTAYPARVFSLEAVREAEKHLDRISLVVMKPEYTPEDLREIAASVPSATCYWDTLALSEGRREVYNVSGVAFGRSNNTPFVICHQQGAAHPILWPLLGEHGFLTLNYLRPGYVGHRFLRMAGGGAHETNGFYNLLVQCGLAEPLEDAA